MYSKMALCDAGAQYAEPFLFTLNAGVNTITLGTVEETLIIKDITLCASKTVPRYKEYCQNAKGEGFSYVFSNKDRL